MTTTQKPKQPGRRTPAPARTLANLGAVAALAAAGVALSGCGLLPDLTSAGADGGGWRESSSAVEAGVSPVLFLGDSVAAGQAVPLKEALAAGGAKFVDATSVGGGNLVGPNAQATWKDLPGELAQAAGGVVVYQVTTYDWGTGAQQRRAYERLADQAAAVDAELVLVTMPPIEPDDFYRPHIDELDGAADAARTVAESAEHVEFLDASAVWGDRYRRERDGAVERSTDGIHTCPQGAARFTDWLLDELAASHPGFTPADSDTWANTGWSSDERFHGC